MTDFRARGTIMGPTGLTAVFGMGTGVAPPVWSPERRPAAGEGGPGATGRGVLVTPARSEPGRGQTHKRRRAVRVASSASFTDHEDPPGSPGCRHGVQRRETCGTLTAFRADRGCGRRVGVVKRSAVGTGPLRRSPAVHSQPIDLVVFQEPSSLVRTETSS